jgi:DNA-binding NtrC family response regulator
VHYSFDFDSIRCHHIGMSIVDKINGKGSAASNTVVGCTLAEVESDFILHALRRRRGNRIRTARSLGVSVRSLFDKPRDCRRQGEDVQPSRYHWGAAA